MSDAAATTTSHAPAVAEPNAPIGLPTMLANAAGRAPLGTTDLSQADVLVAFAFGAGRGPTLAKTNQQIAHAAQLWPDIPVLAQSEVAIGLARLGRLVIDLEDDLRTEHGLADDDYVDTTMIAEAAASIVRAAGWNTIGVLAHPNHAARCAASCQRMGFDVIVADTAAAGVDYDPNSTQWWTRRPSLWVAREMGVLAHHALTRRLS